MAGVPLANQLIQAITADPLVELFHSPQRRAYISLYTADGRRETHAVSDVEVERYLVKLVLALDRAPGRTLLNTITTGLAALAFDGACQAVHRRVANLDTSVVIDLGDDDGRAVVCTSDGWQLVTDPPARFVRPPGMLALPQPELRPGALEEFRALCASMGDDAFTLVVGWMTDALVGRAPFPLLFLRGAQGSGKSSTARMVRGLVDPNVSPLRSMPLSERDLAIMADNSALLAFDNVSDVPQDVSDALCRFTSGGGYSTRRLYRDREEELFDVACPVLVTAIRHVVVANDLLDRTLTVQIDPLPTRATEVALAQRFEEIRSGVLTVLLDGVCAALTPDRPSDAFGLPRLADAAVAADAGLAALGFGPGAFSRALLDAQARDRPRNNSGYR
jgi:hypothetical protein